MDRKVLTDHLVACGFKSEKPESGDIIASKYVMPGDHFAKVCSAVKDFNWMPVEERAFRYRNGRHRNFTCVRDSKMDNIQVGIYNGQTYVVFVEID